MHYCLFGLYFKATNLNVFCVRLYLCHGLQLLKCMLICDKHDEAFRKV